MANRSSELFELAQDFLSGGVSRNTLLRDPHPLYVKQASGCRVVDVDGVEYIDFANNMAAMIHGHAHPAIVEAVTDQLQRGSAFTLATEAEIEYARCLCERSTGFDKIRFMNSGTEAVMAGVKAARAYTGRQIIAKAEGTYHGAYDYVEVSQAPTPQTWGPPERPSSVPLSAATPPSILEEVVVLPYNNAAAAVETLNERGDELACVLLDLMPHRVGFVPVEASFVEAIYDWTRSHGVPLMFDEVITLRAAVGGMQELYQVQPDLTAMGKIIGGGFPVGALAGRDDVMAVFASQGGALPLLPHSGTFSANPITMTAGRVAMDLLDAAAIERLNELGNLTRSRLEEAISTAGVPACVTGAGSLFRIHMKSEPPTDYRSCFPTPKEKQALAKFVNTLYDEGIVMIHTGAGALSTPMDQAEIDRLAEAVLTGLRKIEVEVTA